MPSLDSCLTAIFEPGFIPADPGVPPTQPHIPQEQVGAATLAGNGSLRANSLTNLLSATFAGNGILRADAGLKSGAAARFVGESFLSILGIAGAPPPLDGLGATSAFSVSRDLLTSFVGGTRYTTAGSGINLVTDQTGNSRNLVQTLDTNRPAVAAAGSNSRDSMSFDGVDNYIFMSGVALSNVITNSTGYIICSCVVDAVSTNDTGSVFNNDALFFDNSNFMGVFGLNNAGAHTLKGYNWDGNADSPTAHSITTGATLVVEWKHTGGNILTRINGVTWNSAASGNTSTVTGALTFGAKTSGTPQFMDVRIIDIATFNTILTSGQEDVLVANFLAWAGA